jgi:hypothetical protein
MVAFVGAVDGFVFDLAPGSDAVSRVEILQSDPAGAKNRYSLRPGSIWL